MKLFSTFCACVFAAACTGLLSGEAKPPVEANPDEDMDTVVLNNRNAPPVPPTKVVQDDYLAVVGKYKNSTIKKEAYLVKEVIYADKSGSYSRALDKRDEGRYSVAALNFANALDEMKEQKWAAEYCNYGIANAFYTAGTFDGYKGKLRTYAPAADYFKKVLEANPKSRYLLDVVTKLPVCLAEEGKIAEAEAAVKDAGDRIKKYLDEAGKLGAGYAEPAERAKVQLAMAKARIAEKKAASKDSQGVSAANARDLWHEARAAARKFPDLLGECVDGELRNMIAMKQYDEAKTEASDLIRRFTQDNEYSLLPMLPAAYITLGNANFEQARDYVKKGNKPLANASFAEARWAFLNVVAKFFDNDEYVAFAHYKAGTCYDQLRDQEDDAEKKAIREWKTVVSIAPKSDYMKMAVERLAEHGVKIETPAEAKPAPAVPAKAAPK